MGGLLLTLLDAGVPSALTAQVLVTPDGQRKIVDHNTSDQVPFTVQNTGPGGDGDDASETYELACAVTGSVTSCTVDRRFVTVEGGQGVTVYVDISVGASGSGEVWLEAFPESDSPDDGHYDIAVDASPPTMSFSPAGGAFKSSNPSVTIGWCDDTSLRGTSRTIILNGTEDVTDAFDYQSGSKTGCAAYRTSTGPVSLSSGSNTLTAQISDALGKQGSGQTAYVHDDSPPSVSISPSGGSYTLEDRSVTIHWCDNHSLDRDRMKIILNSTDDVTDDFNYVTDSEPGCGAYARSWNIIELSEGSNTLTAEIGDVTHDGGNLGSGSAVYTYKTPPDVTITPGDTTVSDADLAVSVEWCDNGSLNGSSRTVTLNDTTVTTDFRFGSKAGCGSYATSSATVTLAEGSNTLTAAIDDNNGYRGSKSANHTYDPDPYVTPAIDTSPHNGEYRDVAKCVVNCFDAVVSYSTPAYVSMDAPRSATLVYRSDQAHPIATVIVDATDTESFTPPDKMSIGLKRADGTWETLINGSTEIFYRSGSGTTRLAAAFDASGLSTGAYNYTVVVRSWWDDGTSEENTAPVRVLVANESDSALGAGWTVLGLQRIFTYGDSVVISEGDGSLAFFARIGCPTVSTCEYASPAGDFTTVTGGNGYSYTRVYPDGTEMTFGASGRLQSVADRFGNTTTFAYKASNDLRYIRDPIGELLYFSYDSNGDLFEIRGLDGRYTGFRVDASGDLTTIINPARDTLSFDYDVGHRLLSQTDPEGGVTGFVYSYAGRIAADSLPRITLFDGSSRRPTSSFRSAVDTLLASVAAGNGTSTSPAARFTPDAVSVRVTGARGHDSFLELNRFGQATRVEDPLGRVVATTYDADGQVTETVAPSGHEVDYFRSGVELDSLVDRTTGRRVRFEYEGTYHQVTHVWGDTPEVWNYYGLDAALDSTRVGADSAAVTKYFLNSSGRPDSIVDPAGHARRFSYGGNSWQNVDAIGTGRRVDYRYDASGRVRTTVNALGDSILTHYDDLNRRRMVVGALRDTTHFTYDALFLRQVTDAEGQVYAFERNALGWITKRTDPLGKSDVYRYDAAGNVKEWRDRLPSTLDHTYTYDALGRVTSHTIGNETETYAYAPDDRWIAAANDESVDTVRYDAAGRVTHQITVRGGNETYVLRSSHNAQGRRKALWVGEPSGWTDTVRYGYNAALQLDSLRDLSGGWTTVTYNDDLQPRGVKLPTGIQETGKYPSTHRPYWITWSDAAVNEEAGSKYHYDAAGRVDRRYDVELDSVWMFEYDRAGQVTRWALNRDDGYDEPCGPEEDPDDGLECAEPEWQLMHQGFYGYDKVGNDTLNHRFTTGNRLRSVSYDDAGNVQGYGWSYYSYGLSWNRLGQLVRVSVLDQRTNTLVADVRFAYDAFGRRVWKRSYLSPYDQVQYLWDGEHVFAELDEWGRRLAQYVYYPGVDRPHSLRRSAWNDSTYYYATDHPGNVVGLIDDAFGGDRLINVYRYRPFGEFFGAPVEGVENNLQYAGALYDEETGLSYMRNRYYNARHGRFVSEDPLGLAGGINPYVYAANSPTNLRDPFGLQPSGDEQEACDEDDAPTDPECWGLAIRGIGVVVSGGIRVIGTGFHHAWGMARQTLGTEGGMVRGSGGTYRGLGYIDVGSGVAIPGRQQPEASQSCKLAIGFALLTTAGDAALATGVGGIAAAGVRTAVSAGARAAPAVLGTTAAQISAHQATRTFVSGRLSVMGLQAAAGLEVRNIGIAPVLATINGWSRANSICGR